MRTIAIYLSVFIGITIFFYYYNMFMPRGILYLVFATPIIFLVVAILAMNNYKE